MGVVREGKKKKQFRVFGAIKSHRTAVTPPFRGDAKPNTWWPPRLGPVQYVRVDKNMPMQQQQKLPAAKTLGPNPIPERRSI